MPWKWHAFRGQPALALRCDAVFIFMVARKERDREKEREGGKLLLERYFHAIFERLLAVLSVQVTFFRHLRQWLMIRFLLLLLLLLHFLQDWEPASPFPHHYGRFLNRISERALVFDHGRFTLRHGLTASSCWCDSSVGPFPVGFGQDRIA